MATNHRAHLYDNVDTRTWWVDISLVNWPDEADDYEEPEEDDGEEVDSYDLNVPTNPSPPQDEVLRAASESLLGRGWVADEWMPGRGEIIAELTPTSELPTISRDDAADIREFEARSNAMGFGPSQT